MVDTSQKREPKTQKNDQILSLLKGHNFLLSLWFTQFWQAHKPTELVQILTVTHTHGM